MAALWLWALGALTGVAAAGTSAAGSPGLLEQYLAGLHTLRTQFTQTVTSAQGRPVESGSGSLLVERPGKFRWDYRPRGQDGQLLIGDGKNLWFYDRELAQVTVRPLASGLTSAPILLLSGSLADLRSAFELMDAGRRDGLQWVQVRSRDTQAGFRDAQLGFHGKELVRMIVHDMLGQTEQLDFSHSQRNVPLAADTFRFKVPAGVDVIGTPQS